MPQPCRDPGRRPSLSVAPSAWRLVAQDPEDQVLALHCEVWGTAGHPQDTDWGLCIPPINPISPTGTLQPPSCILPVLASPLVQPRWGLS